MEPEKNSGVDFPSLSEADFISSKKQPPSLPVWLWIFLITAVIAIGWGMSGWVERKGQEERQKSPFLEVTNREFSLFLWHFPSFLRGPASAKNGYLDAFEANQPQMKPEKADLWVTAPPELIFLYHTWNRLLAADPLITSIPSEEFIRFLDEVPEWKPLYWKAAPSEYEEWLKAKKYLTMPELQQATEQELPLVVRQAFQGWKNYMLEGEQINQLKPTVGEAAAFVEKYPHYGRSYWRNLHAVQGQRVAGINYLKSLREPSADPEAPMQEDELAVFFKIAFFNALKL